MHGTFQHAVAFTHAWGATRNEAFVITLLKTSVAFLIGVRFSRMIVHLTRDSTLGGS